jgi:hypothetical protein
VKLTTPMPALAVLAAVALAGCAGVDTSPAATTATATPGTVRSAPTASPAARPTPIPLPTPVAGDPAAIVARSIPAGWLRLLPASVPAGMTASTTVDGDGYTVRFVDDLHTREITFTDELANPPLPTSDGISSTRLFRGVRATYFIYDRTAPTSQRYLMWDEPGTWPTGAYGIRTNEFYLESTGLTESEFFRVADSVRPLS